MEKRQKVREVACCYAFDFLETHQSMPLSRLQAPHAYVIRISIPGCATTWRKALIKHFVHYVNWLRPELEDRTNPQYL